MPRYLSYLSQKESLADLIRLIEDSHNLTLAGPTGSNKLEGLSVPLVLKGILALPGSLDNATPWDS